MDLNGRNLGIGHVSYGGAYGIECRNPPSGKDQFRTLEFDIS
jgi:hypothetical protein